jgi:pimeloyl-ACP methyl ester carboxylesterase
MQPCPSRVQDVRGGRRRFARVRRLLVCGKAAVATRSNPAAGAGVTGTASCRMTVEGVELHWTEQGTGSPLIVLHGLADSQHTWAAVTAELARRYRVLSLDLPGCGLSDRPDASYGLDWQARVTVAWLDRLGLKRYDVLGHSYGGGVALWLLLYRASSVGKLALVAPGGLGTEVSPLLRLAALFGLFETVGQVFIGPATRLLLSLHGGSLSRLDRRALCGMNSRPGTARAFMRTVRDVMDWRGQTRHVLHGIHRIEQLPAIAVFWGREDRVIPIRHGQALCELLENCSLYPLPGGHFLHWQAPRVLAQALLGFLDGPNATRSRLVRPGSSSIKARALTDTDRLGTLAAVAG